MATDGQSELAGFHQFVGEQLANSDVELSLEQALNMWRHRQEEIDAIREGLADVEAGRTIPMDEHIRRMREQFQIPEDA
jgi:predicted transcriptional regulator